MPPQRRWRVALNQPRRPGEVNDSKLLSLSAFDDAQCGLGAGRKKQGEDVIDELLVDHVLPTKIEAGAEVLEIARAPGKDSLLWF